MDDDILRYTTKYFDNINFSEMNERWIDNVIDSEFTDVEENRMSIGVLFTNDVVQTLLNVSSVCDAWVRKGLNVELEESRTGAVSSRPEEFLWTYLDEMDISIKQLLGAIYFLCSKALKTTSSIEEKEIGVLSAKWYFSCLRVPGSTAYSVFYSSLFRTCIDCLQMPDQVESRDALYKWKHFEAILPMFVSALETLVPILSVFHLGTDSSTVEYVIQKLSELTSSELCNSKLNFDLDFLSIPEKERRRRYSSSLVVTSLAYRGLSTLIHSDLNGDREFIYSVVYSCLNRHILCTRVKKASSIPAKFLVVKENAVSFMIHKLKSNDEFCSKCTQTSLKRLCLAVSDKADFRATVSQAVFNIMYHLKVQDLAELIEWLLLLVDAAETNNRVFAIEVLGLLLTNVPQVNMEGLPESKEVYLTPVPVIFAILTRCDDVSPVVRTKALSILSQHMTRALNVLTEMQEPSIFPCEEFDEGLESDMNGDHRCFWYNFTSFKDMLAEIASIVHRRIEDNNGIARKAALQALENIITFDLEYLSEDNLKLFIMAAKDQNIVMRKQMVQSLTDILEKYPDNTIAQEYWLKCILPLVQDPENTVQSKVLSVIEEKFLVNISSEKDIERDGAFCLLKKLSYGEYLSHQRYLQKAFSCWKIEKKLGPQLATKLEKHLGSNKDELVWFYLSIFATFSKLPSRICNLAVEAFEKTQNWESYRFMDHILKILGCTVSSLFPHELESVRGILLEKLEVASAPVEILPLMIEILSKIERHLGRENELSQFASKMIQFSMNILSPFVANRVQDVFAEDLAIKCITIVKEFCQIFPANITTNLVTVFKCFVFRGSNSKNTASVFSNNISPTLRAHAFAAIGKICLQSEPLAKELLPVLAKELLTSEEDMIRNNVVIILIEMCKRYTSFADKYISLISVCFKDKRYLIRYQSITLIVGLLQEDYIKWKGSLIYCLLSTIIDKKEAIQELGKYCLCQLLYEKKKSVFADHFVDSIFVFNHFPPPDNDRLAKIVRELDRFALRYDEKREQRMQIFKFMLNYMEPSSRAFMINGLCQEIFASVAEGVFPLNDTTKSMVKDCFAILSCKEVRAYDTESLANEVEESEEEKAAKAELIARRLMIVEPVIPVIISLKNGVMDSKSELLTDIVLFLKDILQDYKNDIEDILKDDKGLKMQVMFEMRNEVMQQEKEAKAKNKKETRNCKNPEQPSTHQIVAQLIQQGRESMCQQASSSSTPQNASFRLVPQTPLNKSVLRKSHAPMDVDSNNDFHISSEGSTPTLPFTVDGVQFSSTPRVVLKPLSKFQLPNISRIAIDEKDSD